MELADPSDGAQPGTACVRHIDARSARAADVVAAALLSDRRTAMTAAPASQTARQPRSEVVAMACAR